MGADDFNFTLVDLNKMSYTNEPFIMASQARQIIYVIDQEIVNCIRRKKHAHK